jgi:hypothetical protein
MIPGGAALDVVLSASRRWLNSLLKESIRLPQRLKPSLIREHLPQRWKRCATQKQSFSATSEAEGCA